MNVILYTFCANLFIIKRENLLESLGYLKLRSESMLENVREEFKYLCFVGSSVCGMSQSLCLKDPDIDESTSP